jgi:membrane protease YdiL (CAAX protease family)
MKYIQITVFTFVYIGLGFLFKLDPNEYLLLGVPLGLAFQLFVRKKSIQSAWVRTDEKFNFNKNALLYSALLSIYPLYRMFKIISKDELNLTSLLYNLCIIVGAFGCGYAISKMTKKTAKDTLLCWLTAGLIGSFMFFGVAVFKSIQNSSQIHLNFENFAISILMYTPVLFVIEEVIFRGILDEHISENNQKINYWSILYLSFLWGWWHLPATKGGTEELIIASIILPINHTIVGFFMSLYWRKSGNLIAPGFAHAFIDAIRNSLLK